MARSARRVDKRRCGGRGEGGGGSSVGRGASVAVRRGGSPVGVRRWLVFLRDSGGAGPRGRRPTVGRRARLVGFEVEGGRGGGPGRRQPAGGYFFSLFTAGSIDRGGGPAGASPLVAPPFPRVGGTRLGRGSSAGVPDAAGGGVRDSGNATRLAGREPVPKSGVRSSRAEARTATAAERAARPRSYSPWNLPA